MSEVPTSFFRNRIANHFEEVDLDVVCRKKRSGYAVYWDDDDAPLARLRPTGRKDEVEVYSWEDGKWQRVAKLKKTLPLDEALEYITDDPDDLFFDSDDNDDECDAETIFPPEFVREISSAFAVSSAIGGAVGGMFSGSLAGAAWGAAAAFLCAGVPQLLRGRIVQFVLSAILVGTPAAIPAAAAGALGGSIHAALGSGFGWLLGSAVAGFLFGVFLLSNRFLAWGIGLAAGVTLGMRLVEAISPSADTVRFAVVAIVASISATVCAAMAKWHAGHVKLANTLEDSD